MKYPLNTQAKCEHIIVLSIYEGGFSFEQKIFSLTIISNNDNGIGWLW